MPLSGAERQKRYIERLKRENPLKYEEQRKIHLNKVKQRQKKIADSKKEKLRDANKQNKRRKGEIARKQIEQNLKNRKKHWAAMGDVSRYLLCFTYVVLIKPGSSFGVSYVFLVKLV